MEQKPKLLEQVRAAAGARHLSRRTEDLYYNFIEQFILFPQKRHPFEKRFGPTPADDANLYSRFTKQIVSKKPARFVTIRQTFLSL